MEPFANRIEAGNRLAALLVEGAARPESIVLALPRGGVPVGYAVARALRAPLDLLLVRKLGVPGQRELAMGAVASGGTIVLNDDVISRLSIAPDTVAAVVAAESQEIERQEHAYRGGQPALPVVGRSVIVVDDGLATGASMRAAIKGLRAMGPKHIVVAVPVGARESCDELRAEGTALVCGLTPYPFWSVGQWYVDFSQVSDQEVRALLARSRRQHEPGGEHESADTG